MTLLNMHYLFFGLLLGFGVAIPFGPINIEITRRNLQFGTRHGLAFGMGAPIADTVYLVLLCLGHLTLLIHPLFLKTINIAGSFVLIWFGYQTLKNKKNSSQNKKILEKPKKLLYQTGESFLLTLLNPYTILFWSSVSTQIVTISQTSIYSVYLTTAGVLLGTIGWIFFLNILLHITRHKISDSVMCILNQGAGIILIGFAIYGLWQSFFNFHFT